MPEFNETSKKIWGYDPATDQFYPIVIDADGLQVVRDDFHGGEVLPEQSGSDGVLTFTFSNPVNLVVAESRGANLTSRADPFGATPSDTQGIPLDDGVPTYMPVIATIVKVYVPSGASVDVWGFRR